MYVWLSSKSYVLLAYYYDDCPMPGSVSILSTLLPKPTPMDAQQNIHPLPTALASILCSPIQATACYTIFDTSGSERTNAQHTH